MTLSRGIAGSAALVAAAALGSLAFSPVAGADTTAASSAACTHANTHHVTAHHGVGRITLLPGQCVELSLRTASDGGYAWHTTQFADRSVAKRAFAGPNPPNVGQPGQTGGKPAKGAPGPVGGYTTTYYLLERSGRGTTQLALREEQTGRLQSTDPTYTLTIRGL